MLLLSQWSSASTQSSAFLETAGDKNRCLVFFFASFTLHNGQWPHPQHRRLHAPGPLNLTAHNSSPKFCPNDYISKDLLLSVAAWERLEDQFCTSLQKEEHFVLPQCVVHYFWSARVCTCMRAHTHTYLYKNNLLSTYSLPFSISATHTGRLCIQAAMCSSCSVSIWAAFHCAVVTLSFHTTLTTQ